MKRIFFCNEILSDSIFNFPQDLTFAILKPNTSIKQDDQIPKEFSWEQILFN